MHMHVARTHTCMHIPYSLENTPPPPFLHTRLKQKCRGLIIELLIRPCNDPVPNNASHMVNKHEWKDSIFDVFVSLFDSYCDTFKALHHLTIKICNEVSLRILQ